MHLDLKQINNLSTGVQLAVELKPGMPGYKKFLTVSAYSYDENGRVCEVDKFIKLDLSGIYFWLHCYEISVDYYINDWDVHTEDLINDISLEDIAGLEELEF